MRKLLLLFILPLFLISWGSKQKNEGLAILTGKWTRELPYEFIMKEGEIKVYTKLNLYKVENGVLNEIASSGIARDSTFAFAFRPKKNGGFYYIGVKDSWRIHRYDFYFKPGDVLDIVINDSTYVLNKKNPENEEMKKWSDFTLPLVKKTFNARSISTYVDFFPLLETKIKELKNYPKQKTKNKNFNQAFEKYKELYFADIAYSFLSSVRSAYPNKEDYIDYYRNFDPNNITKSAEITLNYYPGMLDLIMKIIVNKIILDDSISEEERTKKKQGLPFIILDESYIVNDTLKGEFVVKLASLNKTYSNLSDYLSKYGNYLITEQQKQEIKYLKGKLNKISEGSPAIDFKFPDVNGKQIALSDFKGKVVYVDVWATWCGPCKAEIPHLKALEKEFHGNDDIVFLGVSTNAAKDYQKWKDFLEKENLLGYQLFAGDDVKEKLLKPYGIAGIPRFILVGKNGNIISADAPRPSSPEIRPLLKDALSK